MFSTAVNIATEIARFWFILVVLYLLYRLADISLAEFSFKRKVRRDGPRRYFGYLTVVDAPDEEILGERYGLKWENSLGSGKQCDIRIPGKGVQSAHAVIFINKKGTFVSPVGKSRVVINDEIAAKKNEPLYDSDELTMGAVKLRVRLENVEVD